jgi:Bacterial regulatory protein, Fis family
MTLAKVVRTLAEIEREYILDTLAYCEGNRTYAANLLNISVRGLRNKLVRYRRAGWSISAHNCAQSITARRFGAKHCRSGINGVVWC